MSLLVDSVSGVDVALAVAGPGARAFAFLTDFVFRTILGDCLVCGSGTHL